MDAVGWYIEYYRRKSEGFSPCPDATSGEEMQGSLQKGTAHGGLSRLFVNFLLPPAKVKKMVG